jgi:hypothetical protein
MGMIHVLASERSEREVLHNLLQPYAYDFSEVLPTDVDDAGRFKVPAPIGASGQTPSSPKNDQALDAQTLPQPASLLSERRSPSSRRGAGRDEPPARRDVVDSRFGSTRSRGPSEREEGSGRIIRRASAARGA